ncbi:MAG TPA: carbonic anhydrase [Candidatus Wunengus sp. YC61]|uniref:carbonic anhydrase n=1 Tax=Candidatus Wunengus sp. YC61 TaxID=3367698 RepID=UPI004028FAB5
MEKKLKPICFVIALFLLIPIGCTYNNLSSTDLLVNNQQIATAINPETSRSDCDTLLITCIDYRYAFANQEFINETLGLKDNYDHISIPGSIYNLVNPETQDLLFSKFSLSVKLHLIKRVVIISHRDCGGYGGSASFGSEISEYETLCDDLRKARALLIEKYPTLEVKLFLEALVKEGDQVRVNFEKIS